MDNTLDNNNIVYCCQRGREGEERGRRKMEGKEQREGKDGEK